MLAIRAVQRTATAHAGCVQTYNHLLSPVALRLRLRHRGHGCIFQTRLSHSSCTESSPPTYSKLNWMVVLEHLCLAVMGYISYHTITENSSKTRKVEAAKKSMLKMSNLATVTSRRVDTSSLYDLTEYFLTVARAATTFAGYPEDVINRFTFRLHILFRLSKEAGLQHELLSILQTACLKLHSIKHIDHMGSLEGVEKFSGDSDIVSVVAGCLKTVYGFEEKVYGIHKAKTETQPQKDDDSVYISIG